MTRFARARGSKSSNEKLPEEATSWSEMKKAMLLKPEKVKDNPVENIINFNRNTQEQKETSWANLSNDSFSGSNSLLKQNNKLKQAAENKNSVASRKIKKQKNVIPDALTNQINSKVKKSKINIELKKKKKMQQPPDVTEKSSVKNNVPELKKGTKRKLKKSDSLEVSKKKKVKVENEKKVMKKKKLLVENITETNNKSKMESENTAIEKSKNFIKNKKKNNFKDEKNNRLQLKPIKFQNKHFTKNYNKKFVREKHNFSSKKPDSAPNELIVNGEKIRLIKFQGFYVTFKDAEKLKKLRADMIKQGIPKAKLEAALKLERRRAEKSLSRLKKSVCFHCRGSGHLLTNCPLIINNQNTGIGICYKCGSTEHTSFNCKVVKDSSFQFAECFICKEQGHIARQCPDNPRGLYPHGGACKICGDVTHLKKDCPQFLEKKTDEAITVKVRSDRDLECLDEEVIYREKDSISNFTKKISAVKF